MDLKVALLQKTAVIDHKIIFYSQKHCSIIFHTKDKEIIA